LRKLIGKDNCGGTKRKKKTRGDTEHTLLYPEKSTDSRAKSRIHCAGRSEKTEHMHTAQSQKFSLAGLAKLSWLRYTVVAD
jgi:hypothetical protein